MAVYRPNNPWGNDEQEETLYNPNLLEQSKVPVGAGAGASSSSSLPSAGSMPVYGGLSGPQYRFTDAPEFTPTAFRAPTQEEATNEPGYMFRRDQGVDALNKSAAARGVLRTGGTLKNIIDYGQNFAASEYDRVYDRALKSYGTRYQGERDAYMPKFQSWMFLQGAEKDRAMAEHQAAQNIYGLNLNAWNQANSIAASTL
jgi:hypothetical protein